MPRSLIEFYSQRQRNTGDMPCGHKEHGFVLISFNQINIIGENSKNYELFVKIYQLRFELW